LSDSASLPAEEAGPDPKTERFLELLGAHERSLFAYVYAMSPAWADAEEVMQRVRIRIWHQFDQYDESRPFDVWARAIAYYLMLAYRKEKSRQRQFFDERVLEAVHKEYEAYAEQSTDRREALLACLDKLDGRKRELVDAYYQTSRQPTDVLAGKLSMTPNALRQALFRIRRLLLECVERAVRVESR
jgi:RNA polymerase sigma-70 factor (ECF subfamily)